MSVTANQVISRKDDKRSFAPVKAGEHIYEGTMFFINSSGLAVADTGSGANKFGGIAVQEYDNTSGADGDLNAQGLAEDIFELVGSGFTQASVGLRVYATDNFTIVTDGTTANAVLIGTVEYYVSATVLGCNIDSQWTKKLPTTVRAGAAQAPVATTAPTNTTPYGFSTSAQAAAIVTLVNELQAAMVAAGIIKGSA